MNRSRASGIVLIVFAAIVSSGGSVLLARRALVDSNPLLAPEPAVATDTSAERAAIDRTLACLAAQGLVPSSESEQDGYVTRISVDLPGLDDSPATAAIERCRAVAAGAAVEIVHLDELDRAAADVRHAARAIFVRESKDGEARPTWQSEKASHSRTSALIAAEFLQ